MICRTIFLFLFLSCNAILAQRGKIKLCIHDNIKASPSYDLTYYWWDPYHLHFPDKTIDPDGVKKDFYQKSEPPYNYCFFLKPGRQQFKIVSCFNDSIFFDISSDRDTTLFFQEYVRDYYKIVTETEKLLDNFKKGDLITIHIAKFYSDNYESLRMDLEVDDNGLLVKSVNRKAINPENVYIDYDKLNVAVSNIENAAAQLSNPSENGYVVTIRKNREVIEYKGKKDTLKIGQLFAKLKKILKVTD